MKKLFFTILLGATLTGPVKAATYPGCDCNAVRTCEAAICFYLEGYGIGCLFSQELREEDICLCKLGAMKHCTNWETDLANCTRDTKDMKAKGKCSTSNLKAKYGKHYDKAIEAGKQAVDELILKQKSMEKSSSTPTK